MCQRWLFTIPNGALVGNTVKSTRCISKCVFGWPDSFWLWVWHESLRWLQEKQMGKDWRKRQNIRETAPFPATCSSAAIPSRLALLLNWYEYYDIKIIWHTTLWHRELSVSTHGFSHSTHRNAIDGLQGRNFSPRNSGRWFFPLEIGSNASSRAVETFPLGRCGLFHEGMAASEKQERLGVEHNSAMWHVSTFLNHVF